MNEYKVGYGKPPLNTRFKPGISGNPKGRPKQQFNSLVESVAKAFASPFKYRERGRTKSSTYGELAMRILVDRAASGDVAAAKALLRAYAEVERNGDVGASKISVKNWIATAFTDHSARRKARNVASATDVKVSKSSDPSQCEPGTD